MNEEKSNKTNIPEADRISEKAVPPQNDIAKKQDSAKALSKTAPTVKKQIKKSQDASKIVKELQKEAEKKPIDYQAKAQERRKRRRKALIIKSFFFVILPVLASAIYYLTIASDQYQSTCAFSVHSAEGKSNIGLDSIIGTIGGTGGSKDAMTVQEYILSRDMLEILNLELGFISHYQDENIDILSRLPKDSAFEEAFEYYLKKIDTQYNTESRVMTLSVKAFCPEKAREFALAILKHSEKKVNQLSEKIQKDQLRFSAATVEDAEKRLTTAQKKILELQHEQSEFNPMRSAMGLTTVKEQLQSELAKARTDLNQLRAVMAPTAPKVLELSQRVQSLQRQIKQENARILGVSDEGGLNISIVDFEMAILEKEFAQKEYEAAMTSFKMAQLETMKQSSYLVTITNPSLPDISLFPRRGIKILTTFLLALAVFAIISLLIAAVKEHARI